MFEEFVRWVFHPGGVLFSGAVLLIGAIVSWRRKRLPALFVFLIAITTCFWQETYGDWGAYVLYDHHLAQMPWGSWPFTAPSKPWGILGGYTWFQGLWGLFCAFFIFLAARKLPKWNTYIVAVLVTIPIWYLWDVAIEYSNVRAGVWSYIAPYWPVLHSEKGTFPLLWPILEQIPFNAFTAWIVFRLWRDPNGLTPLDHFVPVAPPVRTSPGRTTPARGDSRSPLDDAVAESREGATAVAVQEARPHTDTEAPSWDVRYELARVATWCIGFNVVFFVTCIGPLMLVRILFGDPNPLIP